MGSFAFPVPGVTTTNPTGINGAGGIMPAWGTDSPVKGTTAFAPPTGSPGNYGYGTSGNPNPTIPNIGGSTSFYGSPSMNPSGSPTTGSMPTVGSKAFAGTFGSGIAPFLASELNTGGGYNSALTEQNVQAQIADMTHTAQVEYGNLVSGMGGAGVSPNSSAAALETGDYWSNVTKDENAITAQEYFNMWNQSQNRETQLLGAELDPLSHNRGGALQWFDQFSSDVANLFG